MQVRKEDVVGIEPKHITYVKSNDGTDHDLHVVKEVIHLKDGTLVPRLRTVEDYKRPFYVTSKGRRNHKEKKDYEYVKNCQKYTSTQIQLSRNIVKILGDYSNGPNPTLRKLARSPYLYGTDISSSALLKADYRRRWPDLISHNRVAGGDIETNVHTKDEEIIMMSVTHKTNAALFYLKEWISDVDDPITKTHELAQKHIGDTLKERNVTLEVHVCETPGEIVVEALTRLHEWKPDFFAFWNIDFDIPKMVNALEEDGINPADIFSDPSLPSNYKYFYYHKGPTQKVTASGKTMSINFEDRWNWVNHPASFQCIDAMPVYRNLRLASGMESSYALDYILEKELGMTKLKFDEVSHLTGRRWHEVMQEKHKVEYGVYNIFDSMVLEMLDEHTHDLALNISLFSGNGDYSYFNSNPRRLTTDMHFWYLNRDEPCVIGSSSDEMSMDIDKLVVGTESWIITLPSYMLGNEGLKCIKEVPTYNTNAYGHISDLD